MEYRIAKGWRIFVWVFFLLMIGGGAFLIGKAFTEPSMTRQIGLVLSISILFIGLMTLGWLDAIRTLVVIDEHTMAITRAFKSRTVSLKDIEGYRIGEKGLISIELKDGGKAIRLPQYLEREKELKSWITEKYEDLDVREKEAETEVLLENDQFGVNREEREARLSAAKKIDGAATAIGIGLLVWSIFFPQPYETLMLILLLAPWLAIGITWYFKGLMKLYKLKKSPYPSVVQLMFMATFSVGIAVLRSYNLYLFGQKAWSLLIGIALAAAIICIAACRQAIASSSKKMITYVCIFLMAGIYSYSLLIFSNCYYDTSSPAVIHVAVTGKRISSGKSTSYYLSLSPWGRYTEGKEVSVPKSFYQNVQEADSVTVFLNNGKWDIPWYRLRRWTKNY